MVLDQKTFLADINVGAKTKVDYGRSLDLFQRFLDGREPNEAEARAFMRHLAEQGLKAASRRRHGCALRRYHKWATKKDLDLELPSAPRELPEWLPEWLSSMDRIGRVLEAAQTPLEKAIVMVLYDSAIRIAEMLDLKKEDVLWEQGFLRVRRKKKTRAMPEFVPIGEKTLEALREYMAWSKHRGEPLFPYTYNEVYYWLKKLGKRAGVGRLTPHMFRHLRAGGLRIAGTPREDIQDLLGHVKPETTAIYDHILPADLKRKIPPGF